MRLLSSRYMIKESAVFVTEGLPHDLPCRRIIIHPPVQISITVTAQAVSAYPCNAKVSCCQIKLQTRERNMSETKRTPSQAGLSMALENPMLASSTSLSNAPKRSRIKTRKWMIKLSRRAPTRSSFRSYVESPSSTTCKEVFGVRVAVIEDARFPSSPVQFTQDLAGLPGLSRSTHRHSTRWWPRERMLPCLRSQQTEPPRHLQQEHHANFSQRRQTRN